MVQSLHLFNHYRRLRDRLTAELPIETACLALSTIANQTLLSNAGQSSYRHKPDNCDHDVAMIRSYGGPFGRVRICDACGSRWKHDQASGHWKEVAPKASPTSSTPLQPKTTPAPKAKGQGPARGKAPVAVAASRVGPPGPPGKAPATVKAGGIGSFARSPPPSSASMSSWEREGGAATALPHGWTPMALAQFAQVLFKQGVNLPFPVPPPRVTPQVIAMDQDDLQTVTVDEEDDNLENEI